MIRINDFNFKSAVKAAILVGGFLLCAAAGFGQQTINLSAAPTTATQPDGTVVPMWGYFCGAPAMPIASGTAATSFTATTATVTGSNYAANAYVGKTLTVGGVSGVVTANNATTLTVSGWFPNAGTNSFTISAVGTNPLVTSPAASSSYTLTSATGTTLNMPLNGYAAATVTVTVGTVSVTGTVASNTATTVTLTAAGWANATPAANTAIAAAGSTGACAALNPNSLTPASVTPAGFAANHSYALNATVLDSNGNVQVVTNPGTSGATAPTTWGTTAGAQTTSGAVGTAVTFTFQSSLAAYVAPLTTWSPVVITVPSVPTGTSLTVNLTNNLSFTPTGSATANTIPTSLVIVGQVGGGLGNPTSFTQSPDHTNAQGCITWFIASGATPPGVPCPSPQAGFSGTPPVQGPRVQSFSTEVAAGTSSSLTWSALKPGTYLLESGTHPSIQVPMGLIGVLVVTAAPGSSAAAGLAAGTGCSYGYTPATTTGTITPASCQIPYNAELPLEFSEIDPVQNKEVDQAVRTAGFSETGVWTRMNAFGAVSSLTFNPATGGGTGYTLPLTVTFTPAGAGSGAAATATLGTVISSITVGAGGMGYTAPTVTITDCPTLTGTVCSGGTGQGATATATVVNGVITQITVTNPGSGYQKPVVTITDPSTTATTGASGASATAVTAGTYGSVYSVSLTNGGDGYTAAPLVSISGGTTPTTAASVTAAITLGGCGGGAHTCYPPVVNYTPFYYLINGLAFDKTNAPHSVFQATAGVSSTNVPITTPITGTVLVRLVNAGLRMHVPSIVGSQTAGFTGAGTTATNPVGGFTLIAEDGNVVPGTAPPASTTAAPAPRVQTDVFMAAGKTFDVMINAPAAATTGTTPALPVYDRSLSLSGNSSVRDAGMVAYISVNNSAAGAGLPVPAGTGIFAPAHANDDTYDALVGTQPVTVSDPSKGVIANDVNVYGVTLLSLPANGTVTCPAAVQGVSNQGICANGTFTYTPNTTSTATTDSFMYCANNGVASGFVPATTTTAASCSTTAATVHLGGSTLTGNPSAITQAYTAKTSTYIKVSSPGLLIGNTDPSGLPLSLVVTTTPAGVTWDAAGGFSVLNPAPSTTVQTTFTFNYTVQNSQGRTATGSATVTFPAPSNLNVKVVDAQQYNACNGLSTCITALAPITDYRWIIEEDRTFYVDPNCTSNTSISTPGCPAPVAAGGTIPLIATNFHTSSMPYVAQGCTGVLSCEGGQTMLDTRPACTGTNAAVCSATAGQHIPAVCDLGNGACRPDPNCTALPCTTTGGTTPSLPSSVVLDPSKRYYISVLPGDAANPFAAAYSGTPAGCGPPAGPDCGHTQSGAPIPAACNVLGGPNACTASSAFAPVTVLSLPTPLPPGKLSVMVFEDDFPLNGEQDSGGGVDVLSPLEPGLGGFNIVLWDTYGGLGDVTGQNTYDMFNQPLSNALSGQIDPATGLDACPISAQATANPTQTGITGMIVTCPKYESDGMTLSPLAGQAVVANLMQEKFSVQAYPGADRIARGEEWLQTNTLDGQHAHDSFIRIGEPSYFQEYGPAGYHVSIGFANPKIINARYAAVCAGLYGAVGPCSNTIDGTVNVQRLSRTPDQRLYPSGSHDQLGWTQCWVSLGDPDAEDFMFTKCDANGNFKFSNVPGGNWRLTIGDQWNDQIIDGLSTPANVGCVPPPGANTCTGGLSHLPMGNIGVQQWQSNIYTKVFIDDNKNGIPDTGEIGLPLAYVMVHYRDGHNSNALTTDFNGVANFNETFPLFNWYVVEADDSATATRYKTTGIHTVYDAGGPADGSTSCGSSGGNGRPCGTAPPAAGYQFMANTYEAVPLPADLSVPGAVYCKTADCAAEAGSAAPGAAPTPGTFQAGTAIPSSPTAGLSTGRIDPPWVSSEAWSGLTGQSNWIEIGKAPYASCPPSCVNVPNSVYNPTSSTGSTTTSTIPVGENGGIQGIVDYASTRPFDSAQQMIQQPWEAYVPGVTINLYQEGFAADGVTPTLTLVDTTKTSSWDDWAQGFYPASTAGAGTGAGQKPYMSCPGQATATSVAPAIPDLFFYTIFDQPNFLSYYNSLHGGPALLGNATLPYNSQFKCYDAMHIWNQLQPAPFDGKYSFPSSLGRNPTNGKPLTVKGCVGNTPGTACPGASTTTVTVSSLPGTNCTVCVANPDTTDVYRVGTPMLPPGKYVVEVVMPPGYEVYKEEDKNLLIGDNYIAPVTQQFGGLGDVFIIPDQAAVASMYDPNAVGYNPNNFQNQTTDLSLQGGMMSGVPGFPGFQDPNWPCVGEKRVVPDYLSLFPQALEVAPFASATRPLCDRKEVTLASQTSAIAKFFIYTSTHIASKFTGVITDDFTAEFDPFSPQFGEKFAPPNLPISTRDYLGNEISRVYSDHFGIYDGLTYSSWEVNPPNITGYSPSMMVQCMNDYGPILDTNPSSPTVGQMINDPLYNPSYSDFCYEEPYMPSLTTYLDTPVVPTQAFVGAGYNNPDCAYPDATPAIAEVDGDGIGPYVSGAAGHRQLTITALGNTTLVANQSTCTTAGLDAAVNNAAYAGPSANTAPFNCKTVSRHYGFGPSQGTGSVALLGTAPPGVATVPLNVSSWGENTIVATIPNAVSTNPHFACPITQQAQYGGSAARCGQLVITAANGRQSIDTVTVTVGGKAPTHVPASGSIQAAIDNALPGDLIIVDPTCTSAGAAVACTAPSTTNIHNPATHTEMLIMWKPVRLQGAGAASTIINANAIPAGKLLDPWRRHINCYFGNTLQGFPLDATHPYDPNGVYACPDTTAGPVRGFVGVTNSPQIDRMPSEGTIGWDATLNGNLAELLQEPSLMGAYEGAGITVLAKGVELHGANPFDSSLEGAFPAGSNLLTGVVSNPGGAPGTNGALLVGDANPLCHTLYSTGTTSTNNAIKLQTNPYPSNFMCNPSSIDGLTVTNSSQGGGGVFVHGWAHFLQIGNNRVYNNAGTLSGAISVGQGEFGPPYILPLSTIGNNLEPGTCSNGTGLVNGQHAPWCLQMHVNVHNNMITNNSSIGDELFSATLSGGGGVSICTGNDYYMFNYNWVCGNLSSGEGGGMVHLGEIFNGTIAHNSFVLNESSNPTIPTNGGGIMVQGTPDTDPVCPGVPDADCPAGLSDGTGPNLLIDANLIQANSADSGSGGGIRLNQVNGTEVGPLASQPTRWNNVTITNNIIVNNMAGWDGAGISLQDALNVNIINNTIAHNDTLANAGVLTYSIGTPQASAPAGNCVQPGTNSTASCPQPAGVSSTANSIILKQALLAGTVCPAGHPQCTLFSNPLLFNDVFWQNRSFYIGVGGYGSTTQNQQKLVTLFNAFSSTAAPTQTTTGACSTGVTYWDLGVRGDTTLTGHESGFTLTPQYSILTAGTTANNNSSSFSPVAQYCNGSRVPPECTSAMGCAGLNGFGVPPGISDAVTPNPVFTLVPAATVDEGNNWINVSWGPLSLANDAVAGGTYGNYGGGLPLANYNLAGPTPNGTTSVNGVSAPATDFFGNPRPATPNKGAVQSTGTIP